MATRCSAAVVTTESKVNRTMTPSRAELLKTRSTGAMETTSSMAEPSCSSAPMATTSCSADRETIRSEAAEGTTPSTVTAAAIR
jgi:hypothetical protein